MNTEAPLCGLTATAMTALVDAVRAGDIEAAQALLPVDPIVKRAREICGRHFGDPARFLRGECDDGPHMGAVTEALGTTQKPNALQSEHQIRLVARAACYVFYKLAPRQGFVWMPGDFLDGSADRSDIFRAVQRAVSEALDGKPVVAP